MIERIVRIGAETPLTGVVCEPGPGDTGRPTLLILNSGVMHHVGPCRLGVLVSRHLAQHLGVRSLRFDFSSVGDSPARPTTLSVAELHRSQIREVMDHCAEARGCQRFILFGLCSGAHDALDVAVHEPRVEGIVQVDGWCFPTWRSYLSAYAPKLLSPSSWARFVKRSVRSGGQPTAGPGRGSEGAHFEVPDLGPDLERDRVARDLGVVTARGVRQLTIFVGEKLEYNHPNQYLECFSEVPFGDLLELHYWPDATHILAEPTSRDRTLSVLSDWITQNFPV